MDAKQKKALRAGFDIYWAEKLAPQLAKKEALRKRYLTRFFVMLAIALLIIPLIYVLGSLSHGKETFYFNRLVISLLIAGGVFIVQHPYYHYKKHIKQDIMPLFISYFQGFSYHNGDGLTRDELEDSYIFPRFDTFEADDCFEGVYQDVKMRVMEERLKVYQHTKNGRREVKVFQGVAVECDVKKNIKARTIVLKDSGIFNRFKSVGKLERIRLEDVKFEKMFEVFGTDQIESRRLLTPIFMERLLKLKDLFQGKSIQFSFQYGKLLIAIATNQDMFEPFSFFKSNLNRAKVGTVFEQFLTIFEIIDILKL